MKPAINILESGNIVLDCLNEHHDYVEINTKDVLCLRLNQDNTIYIAFFLDNHSNDIGILESTGNFLVSPIQKNHEQVLCVIENTKLQWTIFNAIRNCKKLPINVYPSFICVQDNPNEIVYINFDKLEFTCLGAANNKTQEENQYKPQIEFVITNYLKGWDCFVTQSIFTDFDKHFVQLLTEQLHSNRIKNSEFYEKLCKFIENIEDFVS